MREFTTFSEIYCLDTHRIILHPSGYSLNDEGTTMNESESSLAVAEELLLIARRHGVELESLCHGGTFGNERGYIFFGGLVTIPSPTT